MKKSIIIGLLCLFLVSPNVNAQDAQWWNGSFLYRTELQINVSSYPGATNRSNLTVDLDVNFTELIEQSGISGTFDINSIRVIEYDESGNVLYEVPSQFRNYSSYNKTNNAYGWMFWIVNGTTPVNEIRRYFIYFNREENGIKSTPSYTFQNGSGIGYARWNDGSSEHYYVEPNTHGYDDMPPNRGTLASYGGDNGYGFASTIDSPTNILDNYQLQYYGYLKVDSDSTYNFYTQSDDASFLFIDDLGFPIYSNSPDSLVVNNEGGHGQRVRTGSISLSKGIHRLRILMHELTGGDGVDAGFGTSGDNPFPTSQLYGYRNIYSINVSIANTTDIVVSYQSIDFKGYESNKDWVKVGDDVNITLDLFAGTEIEKVDALICNGNNNSFNLSQADLVQLSNSSKALGDVSWNGTYTTYNDDSINGTHYVMFNVTFVQGFSLLSLNTYQFYVDNASPEFSTIAYDDVHYPYPLYTGNETETLYYNISDSTNISTVIIQYSHYNTSNATPYWTNWVNDSMNLDQTYQDENIWLYNYTFNVTDWESGDKLNYTIFVNDTSAHLTILSDRYFIFRDDYYPYLTYLNFSWTEIANPLGLKTNDGRYLPLANQTINVRVNATDPQGGTMGHVTLRWISHYVGSTPITNQKEMTAITSIGQNMTFECDLNPSDVYSGSLVEFEPIFWVILYDYSGNSNNTKTVHNATPFMYADDNEDWYYPRFLGSYVFSPSSQDQDKNGIPPSDVVIYSLTIRDNIRLKNYSLGIVYPNGTENIFYTSPEIEDTNVDEYDITTSTATIPKEILTENGSYSIVMYIADNWSWIRRQISSVTFYIGAPDIDAPIFNNLYTNMNYINTDQTTYVYANLTDRNAITANLEILYPNGNTYQSDLELEYSAGLYAIGFRINAEEFINDGFTYDEWNSLLDRNWTLYITATDTQDNEANQTINIYLDNLSTQDTGWQKYYHAKFIVDASYPGHIDLEEYYVYNLQKLQPAKDELNSVYGNYTYAIELLQEGILDVLFYDLTPPEFVTLTTIPSSATTGQSIQLIINISDINIMRSLQIKIVDPEGNVYMDYTEIHSEANVSRNYFIHNFTIDAEQFSELIPYKIWKTSLLSDWTIYVNAQDWWRNSKESTTSVDITNLSEEDNAWWWYERAKAAVGEQSGYDDDLDSIEKLIKDGDYQEAIDSANDIIESATEKGGGGGVTNTQIIAIIVAIAAGLGGLVGVMKARHKAEDVQKAADAAIGSVIELVDERKEYGFDTSKYINKIDEARELFDSAKFSECKVMMLQIEHELTQKAAKMREAYQKLQHVKDDIIERGITTPKAEKLFSEAKELYKKEQFNKAMEISQKAEEEAQKGMEGRTVFG